MGERIFVYAIMAMLILGGAFLWYFAIMLFFATFGPGAVAHQPYAIDCIRMAC